MIKLIRKLYAKWLYRNIPYGVCCCGCGVGDHNMDHNHSFRDFKEYAITTYVEGAIK